MTRTPGHPTPKPGVLISNLGTPDSCDTSDVRKFLKEFLWDPRVIQAPRIAWWFILHLVILTIRPRKAAAAYRKIWGKGGSPLLSISLRQTDRVKKALNAQGDRFAVELGMRYGKPSMKEAIGRLKAHGADRIVIVPLYPQYSFTTTASVEDEALRILDKEEFVIVRGYHADPGYIGALANSVRAHWNRAGKADRLLISFHGIPQAYSDAGDPYRRQCETTADLLASALNLGAGKWAMSFQSRFGPQKWLSPYTDETLKGYGEQGIRSVDVVCPGFSVDCLETLEEISIENKRVFLEAGGREYRYIPCLNDSEEHIGMITDCIRRQLS